MTRLIFLSKVIVTLFAISLFGAINKVVFQESHHEVTALSQLDLADQIRSDETARMPEIRVSALAGDEDPELSKQYTSVNSAALENLENILIENGFSESDLHKAEYPDPKKKIKNRRFCLLYFELNNKLPVREKEQAQPPEDSTSRNKEANVKKGLLKEEAPEIAELIRRYRADSINIVMATDIDSYTLGSRLKALIDSGRNVVSRQLKLKLKQDAASADPSVSPSIQEKYTINFDNIKFIGGFWRLAFSIIDRGHLAGQQASEGAVVQEGQRDRNWARDDFALTFKTHTAVVHTNSFFLLCPNINWDKAKWLSDKFFMNRLDTLYGDKTLDAARKLIGANMEKTEDNVDIIGFKVSAFALPFIIFTLEFMLALLIIISVYFVPETRGEKIADGDEKDWIYPLIILPVSRIVLLVFLPLATLYFVYPVYQMPDLNATLFIAAGVLTVVLNSCSWAITYFGPMGKRRKTY